MKTKVNFSKLTPLAKKMVEHSKNYKERTSAFEQLNMLHISLLNYERTAYNGSDADKIQSLNAITSDFILFCEILNIEFKDVFITGKLPNNIINDWKDLTQGMGKLLNGIRYHRLGLDNHITIDYLIDFLFSLSKLYIMSGSGIIKEVRKMFEGYKTGNIEPKTDEVEVYNLEIDNSYLIQLTGKEIKIVKAVNGWGNPLNAEDLKLKKDDGGL